MTIDNNQLQSEIKKVLRLETTNSVETPFNCRACWRISDHGGTIHQICRPCSDAGNPPDERLCLARIIGWRQGYPEELLETLLKSGLTAEELLQKSRQELCDILDEQSRFCTNPVSYGHHQYQDPNTGQSFNGAKYFVETPEDQRTYSRLQRPLSPREEAEALATNEARMAEAKRVKNEQLLARAERLRAESARLEASANG